MSGNETPIVLRMYFSSYQRGAYIRWESEVLGQVTSRIPMPFAAEDLPLVLRALDALQDPSYPTAWNSAQETLFSFSEDEQHRLAGLALWDEAADRLPRDLPRRVGSRLYDALAFKGDGAQALSIVRHHAVAVGSPLLMICYFRAADAALAALPWELLWADDTTPLLLERRLNAAVERRIDVAGALPPPPQGNGPLRILAVAPRAGIPAELRQSERQARLAAWQPLLQRGLAAMRELGPATPAELERIVREWSPDVVHYYGHGRYEDGAGALLLDGDRGGEVWTSTDALAATLGGVSMVFLHACQGAMTAPYGALLSGIAPALSAAGVPVVLGMQFTVRADAATRVATIVYAGLAQGRSVQESLAAARRALFVAETDRVSWFVPTLYVRSRTTGALSLRPAPEQQSVALTLGAAAAPAARRNPLIKRLSIQAPRPLDRGAAFGGGS
jgi:hypothetical protein